MYSKFYSPNIIATGSSEIDESSYSHHADNDVGVAVIDRYTYYNLDFLENHVRELSSKLTLGDLFDSYDEAKIHSHPGVRWDLFPGGQGKGRERLVMDFFGNVQNVELDGPSRRDGQDLVRLSRLAALRSASNDTPTRAATANAVFNGADAVFSPKRVGAVRIEDGSSWQRQMVGLWTLAACAGVWFVASWMDSSRPSLG